LLGCPAMDAIRREAAEETYPTFRRKITRPRFSGTR
jgi:hypothetical protein